MECMDSQSELVFRLLYVLGAPDAFDVTTATRAALAVTPVAAPLTAAASCGLIPAAAES